MRIERQQRHMTELLRLRDHGPRTTPLVDARLRELAAFQELLVDKQLEGLEAWKQRQKQPQKGKRS